MTSPVEPWADIADREHDQPPAPRERPPHAEFLGLRFCLLDAAETAGRIAAGCEGPFAYVVTPNAPHVVMVHEDPVTFAPIYRGAWMSLCDSQILRALARLTGLALPLVTGSDLVATLLGQQNAASPLGGRRRLLVVGPDEDVARELRARYPRTKIESLPAPQALARRADLRRQVVGDCLSRNWDILLLCLGCPAQELVAAEIAAAGRRTGVALCVGAALDFAAGRKVRAPGPMQLLGLEWAFRLACEPRRLWRRYLVQGPRSS